MWDPKRKINEREATKINLVCNEREKTVQEIRSEIVRHHSIFISRSADDAPMNSYEEEETVLQYCVNADRERWLGPLKRKLPLLFLMIPVFLIVGLTTGWLEPLLLFLGHTFISPLKPLLSYNPSGTTATIIRFISDISWVVYLGLAFVLARSAVKSARNPTQIAITPEGLYFLQHIGGPSYQIISGSFWSALTKVTLKRPKGKKGVTDYRLVLIQDRLTHEIRLGDIIHSSDRAKLISALKMNVDPSVLDLEALEVLSDPEVHESYTELWLRELSAAPKRDKLTPLVAGNSLQSGAYQIRSKIGMGGQGTVYLAEKQSPGAQSTTQPQVVALKEFVLPVFPDVRVRQRAAEKFEQEARMLSKLNHPSIVKFIDLFIEDHRAYLALERIEGVPLSRLVAERGPVNQIDAKAIALSACEILEYLHSQQPPVIHRDFTPDNLILQTDGTIKLIDFSVAQQIESNITGTVVGKHMYMSPEQFRGKPTTKSDIYSLGATLHYILTGCEPEAVSSSHPAEINSAIAPRLDQIVSRATAMDAAARYQTVAELRKDLESL